MFAEMASSLLVHGLPWAAVDVVCGRAFGIGLGGRAQAGLGMVGGLLGADAGAFLYERIGALALPGSRIIEPVAATWGIPLLTQLLAVIPPAAGVAALFPDPPDRRSSQALCPFGMRILVGGDPGSRRAWTPGILECGELCNLGSMPSRHRS
jgi:hypothetical protein